MPQSVKMVLSLQKGPVEALDLKNALPLARGSAVPALNVLRSPIHKFVVQRSLRIQKCFPTSELLMALGCWFAGLVHTL